MTHATELRRLKRALVYAVEAFEKAAETHGCDCCRADARELRRALDQGADIMDPRAVLADLTAAPIGTQREDGAS